ncbi:MAG: IPT/TIG domain-containing protein [Flavobacteriales bacterium]
MNAQRTLLALLAISLVITSCKKEDDPPPANGGGGTGGGPNGIGLITSWSPVKPYPDDDITLTGSGFDTDLADNTVTVVGQPFTIVSASSTQLVVRPPQDFASQLPVGSFGTLLLESGASADTIYPLYYKRPMTLLGFDNNLDEWWVGAPPRVGDSVQYNAIGCTLQGMSVSFNGAAATEIDVDSAYYCLIRFRMPLSLAVGNDETAFTTMVMTATNSDGRTDTLTQQVASSPHMVIADVELLNGAGPFDISDMNSNGDVLNFRVSGRYLKSCAQWELSGPSPTTGTLGVGGFPSEAFIVFSPLSMVAGNYQIVVLDCDGGGMGITFAFTLVD